MNAAALILREHSPLPTRFEPRQAQIRAPIAAWNHPETRYIQGHVPMDAPPTKRSGPLTFAFGPFRLLPAERLLLRSGKPVHLGARALDILVALVERAGETISKCELLATVWAGTVVIEENVKVHIAALRRALEDRKDDNRYVVTVHGRGYCFVAPIIREGGSEVPEQAAKCEASPARPSPGKLIGRDDVMARLTDRLPRQRLLTIVGPGGVGKTSVAMAVASGLAGQFNHGARTVDFSALADPCLVPRALAAALALQNPSESQLPDVLAALAGKQMLLVFDGCEHVIAAAAELASAVLRFAPGVRIIATSREPLRTEGEHVHRLTPLASPPPSVMPSVSDALTYPAVQLFVERAGSGSGDFKLDLFNTPVVAEICRRLDGLPLAIELAAACVDTIGVRHIRAALDDGLRLLKGGHRTAPSRQRSMYATLEWSYKLLSEREQLIFRRLTALPDSFTLWTASTLAEDTSLPEIDVIDALSSLVLKSLIISTCEPSGQRLRMLETARIYGRMKLRESAEGDPPTSMTPRTCGND